MGTSSVTITVVSAVRAAPFNMRVIEKEAIKTAMGKKTRIERFCGIYVAPIVLSTVGRVSLLLLYLLLLSISCYGMSIVKIYFSQLLFVSKTSAVYQWFKSSEENFTRNTWTPTTIFVHNEKSSFQSVDFQNKMHGLDWALDTC